MSEPQSKARIFVLDEDRSTKVDAIAAHLRAEFGGVGVSRSEAIRIMIDRFFLPDWPIHRSSVDKKIETAA